jgi:hypothetical protein
MVCPIIARGGRGSEARNAEMAGNEPNGSLTRLAEVPYYRPRGWVGVRPKVVGVSSGSLPDGFGTDPLLSPRGFNRGPDDLSLVLSSGYAIKEATGNSIA